MNIRPFNPTDAEYEAVVGVINQAWPKMPFTVEAVRYSHEHRNPQYFYQRVVVEDEQSGNMIAVADYFEASWAHVPGKYSLDMDIVPSYEQAVMQPVYDYILAQLAKREPAPEKLVGFTREDKTAIIDFFTSHGFEQVMREPRSEQDVTKFNFARYADREEKLAGKGIRIYTLPELQALDPDWLTKYYDLEWHVDRDIPSPDPATRRPLAQFEKMFNHPNFRADGHFIAVDEAKASAPGRGEYVGVSSIWMRPPSTERVGVGVTGIKRSHRRRGIATVLKVRAAAFVRDIGARYITTENEENNPMYDLNLRLGFEPKPAWLEFAKEVEEAESETNVAELAIGD